jgi:hypothetical protein
MRDIRAVWFGQQFVRSPEIEEESKLVTLQIDKSNGRLLETGE